jgi:sulfur relay (sulfurtransferase) DsrF/TusC family protein
MKKVNIVNESVTETGGVFEDLDAIRELKNANSNPEIFFIEDESVQCTASSHERTDVSPEA